MVGQSGYTLVENILQNILNTLRGILGSSSSGGSSGTGISGIIEEIKNGNLIVGSGINLSDLGGHGTEPFDSALKLRLIEDDEVSGITYIGYSAPDTATSVEDWLIQKIITTTAGSVTTHQELYGVGKWDDRATTLTYY